MNLFRNRIAIQEKQATAKATGKSGEQRGDMSFIEERGKGWLRGAVISKKSISIKWEFQTWWLFLGLDVTTSQWLGCFWARRKSSFLWLQVFFLMETQSVVHLVLLGRPRVATSGTVWELPLLASGLHIKRGFLDSVSQNAMQRKLTSGSVHTLKKISLLSSHLLWVSVMGRWCDLGRSSRGDVPGKVLVESCQPPMLSEGRGMSVSVLNGSSGWCTTTFLYCTYILGLAMGQITKENYGKDPQDEAARELEDSRICHSKICHFGLLIILN